MFERFTAQSRDAVLHAKTEAQQLHHPEIGTEHLLLALLHEDAGKAYEVLHGLGCDRTRIRAEVERLAGAPTRTLTADDAAALRTIGKVSRR